MKALNDLLQELGISKVKLAKYLGVSRQMVYNYLELDNLNKWPKEKKILLFKLLDINDGDEVTLEKIQVNTEYLLKVEAKINQGINTNSDSSDCLDLKGLRKEDQILFSDLVMLLKEKLTDEASDEMHWTIVYLYHLLQSLDNIPEIRYIFAYISKMRGWTKPEDFKFSEDKQFMFEGILYSALNLYNNGGANKNRLMESHKRFVQEIEQKKEEQLTRTQQLHTIKIQALKELNYDKLDENNATEVWEKMAEIESRKV